MHVLQRLLLLLLNLMGLLQPAVMALLETAEYPYCR